MKKLFLLLLIINLSALLYAEYEFEIDAPKRYLTCESVQNWKTGYTDAKIELNLQKARLKLPADRTAAFELIERYAPYLLKDLYLSIIVDSTHRVGDYVAEGLISLDDINKIIDDGVRTSARFTHDLEDAIIYHNAMLRSVGSLFVKHTNAYMPPVPSSSAISKEYTGIIIDIRGAKPVHGEYGNEKMQVSLFPRIWDTNMALVYEKNVVDPSVARSQGIVHYTDSLDESSIRNIVGNNPLRIVARGIYGMNRTDPIISAADSAQIFSRPENMALLTQGKVVFVCDDLKVETYVPMPDENFYFDYHDVNVKVGDDDGGLIVTPDVNNNIIKIIMYDIHFVADMPDILPQDYGRIDVIAEALRRLGNNVKFRIEGHTADLNRPNDQLQLSQERAKTMATELAKRGISLERIETFGYGATVPIAPSDNETNRAKNRRVEIKIIRQ